MNPILDRLAEAERLLDIAQAERDAHGEHAECDECARLDAAHARSQAELAIYRRAFAAACARVWWAEPPREMP